jgi:hypothetical protein
MSVKDDFVRDIRASDHERFDAAGSRPGIEFWPDDFGEWVAAHENRVGSVICNAPEFASSPFCGRGAH